MPEIDHLLEDWRRSVEPHFQGREDVLDELESHLYDTIESQVSQGKPLNEAIEFAMARLGQPSEIGAEFSKVPPCVSAWMPLRIIQICCMVLGLFVIAPLTPKLWAGGVASLLAVHMGLVTLGYLSMLVGGVVGTSFLLARLFRDLSPGQKEYIKRVALFWSALSVVLVGVGIAFGAACPYEKSGPFFGFAAHEVGGIGILLWSLVTACGYWRFRRSPQLPQMMLFGLVGNIVVILGWLGAVASGPHAVGVLSSFPVILLLIGSHLGIGCLAFAPTGCLRSRAT
ncbi:MAG TPA: permease prefix domain 1-containing protein [Planctomicrobium sp.]|nr:permease prefix domain 1-containing protein [Planctomicrobium sp.]